MTTAFTRVGNVFRPVGNSQSIITNLPPKTFVVQQDQQGLFLTETEDMVVPSKIYGTNPIHRVTRIMTTYNDRSNSTGILLTGTKGSGKTMLCKLISSEFRRAGLPTIIVSNGVDVEKLVTFLSELSESLLVFDEFEKVFRNNDQEKLLNLFDGLNSIKKMFVFTSNSVGSISPFLLNRPGRIYYHYHYDNIDEATIREYCEINLITKTEYIEDIVALGRDYATMNFDIIQAVVEEVNRFDETPAQVIKHLNVKKFMNERAVYKLVSIFDKTTNMPIQYTNGVVSNGYPIDITDEYCSISISFKTDTPINSSGSNSTSISAEDFGIEDDSTPNNNNSIHFYQNNVRGVNGKNVVLENDQYTVEIQIMKANKSFVF